MSKILQELWWRWNSVLRLIFADKFDLFASKIPQKLVWNDKQIGPENLSKNLIEMAKN